MLNYVSLKTYQERTDLQKREATVHRSGLPACPSSPAPAARPQPQPQATGTAGGTPPTRRKDGSSEQHSGPCMTPPGHDLASVTACGVQDLVWGWHQRRPHHQRSPLQLAGQCPSPHPLTEHLPLHLKILSPFQSSLNKCKSPSFNGLKPIKLVSY